MWTDEELLEIAKPKDGKPHALKWKEGFKYGFEFAEEQLLPKWVPCTHKKVLPPGRYFIKLYNPATGYGSERFFETRYSREIEYFFVTHYLKIEFPKAPKAKGEKV